MRSNYRDSQGQSQAARLQMRRKERVSQGQGEAFEVLLATAQKSEVEGLA